MANSFLQTQSTFRRMTLRPPKITLDSPRIRPPLALVLRHPIRPRPCETLPKATKNNTTARKMHPIGPTMTTTWLAGRPTIWMRETKLP